MTEPILLLTADSVQPDDLLHFVKDLGGNDLSSEALTKARISIGSDHIWIYHANSELASFKGEELNQICHWLHHPPQSCIVVERSTSPHSAELRQEFARMFVRRWPSVLNGVTHKESEVLFNSQQILETNWADMLA